MTWHDVIWHLFWMSEDMYLCEGRWKGSRIRVCRWFWGSRRLPLSSSPSRRENSKARRTTALRCQTLNLNMKFDFVFINSNSLLNISRRKWNQLLTLRSGQMSVFLDLPDQTMNEMYQIPINLLIKYSREISLMRINQSSWYHRPDLLLLPHCCLQV